MAEPADGTVRLVTEDEMTPQQWADMQAAVAGWKFLAKWPSGKDWAVPK